MTDETANTLATDVQHICDVLRSTLGPFGANKLLVRQDGSVTTTAAGSEVLDQLDLETPAATLLKASADGFADRWGDGTTTMLTLTGALLERAVDLRERGVHPTTVERGFHEALDAATEFLDGYERPVAAVGPAAVARTALTGTRNPAVRAATSEYLATVADELVDAGAGARQVSVIARIGASAETTLVRGLVLDKEPVVENMPRNLPDAGVAVLSSSVDTVKVGGFGDERSTKLVLSADSFEDQAAIGEFERDAFRERLSSAVEAGCRFVVTERAVNDRVKTLLANHGVCAIERVDDVDLQRVVRATGATVVPDLGHVTADALGRADVHVERKAGRDYTFVETDHGVPTFTLFCRAPDPRSATEFEGSVERALASVLTAQTDGAVVPGGGATEVAVSNAVREAGRSIAGREQLVVEEFARALRAVPRTLAVNAGMDGWDGVIQLLVAHSEGWTTTGIDALVGGTTDMLGDDPAVVPASLTRATYHTAADLALRAVRIDAELPAVDRTDDEAPPEAESVEG